jgi:heat-inducible transcriptional repressor
LDALTDLSFRARKILYAVITEYISTGEPVGSRRLSRRYGLNLSPASIRNVLSDLEEMGLLSQPHTSAGRVPTEKGFRLFVDALVQMREVTAEDRASIVQRIGHLADPERTREAGNVLSMLTGAASVVAPPRAADEVLMQLRFVPLTEKQVLAVLVTRSGKVQNRVIRLSEAVDPKDLERVHNYLQEMVDGRSLAEVRTALAEEMAVQRADYVQVTDHIVAATLQESEESEVVISGQQLLFDRPEFENPNMIRAFVRTFEDKERLLSLIDETLKAGGVQVLIGAETHLDEIEDVSLIAAAYRQPGGSRGAVGVIGPARMDYATVVPIVEFTARAMGTPVSAETEEEAGEPE